MSEENFDNSFYDSIEKKEERPTFLTVLIVLTWLSVGMTILGSLSSIGNSGDASEQIEKSLEALEDIPTDDPYVLELMRDYKLFIETSINNMIPIQFSNLILYLIEGFAALLMFNLKRIGFWIYAICQIGFLAVIMNFYPAENAITTFSITSTAIFSIIFCILYGVNLKHLKK